MNKFNNIIIELGNDFESYIAGDRSKKVEGRIIYNLMELLLSDIGDYRTVSREIRLFFSEIKFDTNCSEFLYKVLVIKLYSDNWLKINRINENNENIIKRLKSTSNEKKAALIYLAGSNYEDNDTKYKYLKEATKYFKFPNLLIALADFEKTEEERKKLLLEAKKLVKMTEKHPLVGHYSVDFFKFYHYAILGDWMEKEKYDNLLDLNNTEEV